MKRLSINILIIICIATLCYSGYQIITTLIMYTQADAEYQELQETFLPSSIASAQNIAIDFQKLQSYNADVVAWIVCQAKQEVNHPVVHGKDNQFYLNHTFLREKNSSGAIFMDYRNQRDFSDSHTVIYGHNMKNQSMFGTLKRYQDATYYKENPYIWIYTAHATYKYQIFSAYTTSTEQTILKLTFIDEAEHLHYIQELASKGLFTLPMDRPTAKPILTLATCTDNQEDQRLVVHALRVDIE